MTVEYSSVYISELDPNLPEDSDDISEGAAQIRLVKQNLQDTFPNIVEAMTVSDTYLNDLDDALTFGSEETSDDNSATVYFASINNRRLKGGVDARESTDFTTLGQIQTMIQDVVLNNLYPVGSLFITRSDSNPADLLGGGTWSAVSGALFGSGTFYSVDGSGKVTYAAGDTGGAIDTYLTENNLPEVEIDMGAVDDNGNPLVVSSVDPGHVHTVPFHDAGYSAGSGGGDNFPTVTSTTNTSQSGSHNHTLTGTITIGSSADEQTTVSLMSPYACYNIWERIL